MKFPSEPGVVGGARDPRQSGEVMVVPTLRAPRNAGSGVQIMAPDPGERDTMPLPAPADEEGKIELPASRRVTQKPPRQPTETDEDEDAIIGLPADAQRAEEDLADDEILGLPSQLPASDSQALEEVEEGEMVGLPTSSSFPILPPPLAESDDDSPELVDLDELDDDELEDTIIYPSEE